MQNCDSHFELIQPPPLDSVIKRGSLKRFLQRMFKATDAKIPNQAFEGGHQRSFP